MSSSEQRNVYEIQDLENLKNDVVDKKIELSDAYSSEEPYIVESSEETQLSFFSRLISGMNVAETKGIEPVTDDERSDDDGIINAASMWFSANMVIAALSTGALGPLIYGLNFGASALTIIFFNILGLLPVAYFSVFGVEFGLRQMILSRFLVGNVTARIFALINVIACIGWGIVNTVASAQLLNMVNQNGANLPLWAGCLVIIGATVLVTFFGYKIIHLYQKYAWIPNFAVFLVIIARLKISGNFSNGAWTSGSTTAGDVLSFGSVIFGFATGWTTYASDYTVYMPKSTNKYKIFFCLVGGLAFPLFFCMLIGAACAMGALNNDTWMQYYDNNSVGGLVYAILVPNSLHGFGEFCCVILGLSTVANNVPNMYTIALSSQAMWEPLAKTPRIIWTLAGNAAALAISIPCCYYFDEFMQNFMDSIGYYLAIYSSIALSEHFIWRHNSFKNYNTEDWDNWSKLPIGIAGTAALIVGAFGVALGMSQTYWVGQIARRIGEYGGDIGFELGAGWAFVIYNILRPIEIKYFGR
ncbi:hypothetical protein KAFR_0L00830 [Kazachstania africana CBS 2517]|uniref:Purine-cytosine permease n=1 Tax=Kazachstania africana (strain ATCC 22294 / BCRC 22015 / CBS 2517 / CECT 1963 / NBRC 1671 / NRRL Y-8276) TaxID=1071382 RepID=H2B241_KAZAF|nr:hypothetical protein KAFR_0L00830 [Kazachstania africana CBS 2517]CCF60691.1 hypothetical protein KAFR_0L00830 [Kazachstania africana CBS 2517]